MLGARLSVLTACLCCLLWACGYGQETQQDTLLFCDDKLVEEAVDSALVKLNGMLTSGNQYSLYQILEAKKVENETGTELALRFTSRLSDCPVGGDKAWRDCEYFPIGPESPRTCKANVFVTEGSSDVHLVDCASEPVVTVERAPCLGCPELIDLESEDLKEPLRFSIGQANNAHNEVDLLILKDVVSASRQVVAGFRYQLRFNMQSSNCTKEEFKEVTEECHPHEKPTFVRCNSTVDVAPWRHEVPDGSVHCELGQFMVSRRRPPGWTPLRTIEEPFKTTEPPMKESSEEEQDTASAASTATNLEMTAAPTITTPPQSSSTQKPFHCPSKPWKQFLPQIATVPVPPSTNSSKPESDGLFSDADLLIG
ncbi:kininogen-1 [Alosa pseudoharengus]|uniref:kininogen-1 n=1 Tax=Alosa pseudoharengus TaxID=34774 RepID=UPI003F899403